MTISLYILRHGIAVERGTQGYDSDNDSERPLTSEGKKKMRKIAEGIKTLNFTPDLILSSPYVRAKQTAEFMTQIFDKQVKISTHLAADAKPESLLYEIRHHYSNKEKILLVGHNPNLTFLISTLIAGTDTVDIHLKKGGLCKLQVSTPLQYRACATLEWLLTPSQLMS